MHIPPVSFTDNQDVYDNFLEKYKTHDKGFFILAPSGAGKSYFCKNQAQPDWIDGDELWIATKAHPEGAWWTEPLETIFRIDKRSDVITMEAKELGLWVMGASNNWLKPDAVVVPPWETHVGYIKAREENNYDGGATSDKLDQVKNHIADIKKWNTDHGVPLFESIDEAVAFLTRS